MFFLGIDQHARQITISLRDDSGDVVQARRVSAQPEKVHAFFQQLTRERLSGGESFVAVLEVCGFNDWLIGVLLYACVALDSRTLILQLSLAKVRPGEEDSRVALRSLSERSTAP